MFFAAHGSHESKDVLQPPATDFIGTHPPGNPNHETLPVLFQIFQCIWILSMVLNLCHRLRHSFVSVAQQHHHQLSGNYKEWPQRKPKPFFEQTWYNTMSYHFLKTSQNLRFLNISGTWTSYPRRSISSAVEFVFHPPPSRSKGWNIPTSDFHSPGKWGSIGEADEGKKSPSWKWLLCSRHWMIFNWSLEKIPNSILLNWKDKSSKENLCNSTDSSSVGPWIGCEFPKTPMWV